MSINTNMKSFFVETKTRIVGESGAMREIWGGNREIFVSISKSSENIKTLSARYKKTTHIGLTKCKFLKSERHRLRNQTNGRIYEILSANCDGRITNLLLKEVEDNV